MTRSCPAATSHATSGGAPRSSRACASTRWSARSCTEVSTRVPSGTSTGWPGSSAVTRSVRSPTSTRSPGPISTGAWTSVPFTRVPLRLPRSWMKKRSSRRTISACRRDTLASAMWTSQVDERPILRERRLDPPDQRPVAERSREVEASWRRGQAHFRRSSAVQFVTTMKRPAATAPDGVLTRKRWPSRDTAQR